MRRRRTGAAVDAGAALHSRHNLRNTLAAVAAARAVGVRPSGRVDVRFSALRGRAGRARARGDRHQRLLQREPALDARRSGRPRHAGDRRTARRGARRHARARARASRAPRARWAPTRRRSGVDLLSRSGRGPRRWSSPSAARRAPSPTRPRPPRWPASSSRRATSCWSRARAAWGSRSWPRRSRGLAERRRRARPRLMGRSSSAAPPRCSSASSSRRSSSSSCARASSASRSARRARRSTTPRRARRRWAGSSSSPRSRSRSCCSTDLDARSVGVMGVALACAALGFADDYMKLVKRRSLGPQGPLEAVHHVRDRGRAVADRDALGRSARHAATCA